MIKHNNDKVVFSAIKFIQSKLFSHICEWKEKGAIPPRSNNITISFYKPWNTYTDTANLFVQNISAFWQNGCETHSELLFKISFLTLQKILLFYYVRNKCFEHYQDNNMNLWPCLLPFISLFEYSCLQVQLIFPCCC